MLDAHLLAPLQVSLFSDPAKQPTLIADAEQFFDELVFGDHLDDLVVFRDGLYKLDMSVHCFVTSCG